MLLKPKKIKSIKGMKPSAFAGKTVFLRCDFNVPLKKGKVADDYKIVAGLSTIRYLLRYKCKLVMATHLGEPAGADKKYSTKPIAVHLSGLLGTSVGFIGECAGSQAKSAIRRLLPGGAIMLENLRFESGEKENSASFAKKLADGIELYVNNAFAVCHRDHASVSAIKKYLPSYAGLLLEKEIENLDKLMKPQTPMIAVMGGAKIGTKIKLLKSLSKRADKVLIGGAMANNFLAASGLEIGKSLADDESIRIARGFKPGNLILPVDLVTAKVTGKRSKPMVKNIYAVQKDDYILDIGPKTISLFSSYIKKARTIIWNGPLGYFENEHFKHGTVAIARIISARSSGRAFGAVGGGETIEALKLAGTMDQIDWVSTGGGAMLAYLGGEKMPGIKGLF